MTDYIDLNCDSIVEHLGNTVNKLHNQVNRKFIDVHSDYSEWEIETDQGWSDITSVGKTIEYEVWEITTESGKSLKCADNHIVFDDSFSEIFVKDLNKDSRPDKIWVRGNDGKPTLELVVSVKNLGYTEHMYDVQVADENHRYYTNDILSHNSIVLCNDAANYVRQGKNVLFITCEMAKEKVTRRISANLLDMTLEDYDKLVEDPAKVKRKLNKFMKDSINMNFVEPGKLRIKELPTGQGTVLDVERYIKEVEESQNYKVDVVIIDYINIMCNYRQPNSENTYLKIKTLAEDLRGLAVKYDVLMITASQIGRSALDSSDINLTDVSESMGLMHTVDNAIGIIQTEEMRIGELIAGVATPYYWMKILKIREGEGKGHKFRVDINYDKMKLIERTDCIDTNEHLG